MSLGPSSLGDVELLAVLLRTGSAGKSALDLARELWRSMGERLAGMAEMTPSSLMKIPGMGPGKAACVSAAFELGRRFLTESTERSMKALKDPSAVYRTMVPRLKGLKHEECWTLFLNNSLSLVDSIRVSVGGQDWTTFDIKAIVRTALDVRAAAVILVHNHPSGNPMPGRADIECTGKLKDALNAFDIRLVEHLVFCDGSYYSFAEENVGKVR